MLRLLKPLRIPILAAGLLLVAGVASAGAAQRFAAPGATGNGACPQQAPCSIARAVQVAQAGDEIILAPGNYSDTAGDINAVAVGPGVSLHGAFGAPRPIITMLNGAFSTAAFSVTAGASVSHLELRTSARPNLINVSGGTVEDIVARSTTVEGRACGITAGAFRDSVCLSSGDEGVALGGDGAGPLPPETIELRSLTAVATGVLSAGLKFDFIGTPAAPNERRINAAGVIAVGVAFDVLALASSPQPQIPGTGSEVKVFLDHSDYRNIGAGRDTASTSFVTPAGSATNITARPLFAADGAHQLSNSPTIDAAPGIALSRATDIDEQPRTLGAAPDIGADEFAASTTAVSCAPATVATGQATTCTARVTAPGPQPPSGAVAFASNGKGSFGAPSCNLAPAGAGTATCQIAYRPSEVGSASHQLTASYAGDLSHGPSQGATAVKAIKGPAGPAGPVGPADGPRPNTKLRATPKRVSAVRLAKFSFVSTLPGSRFQCKLDRKPFKSCRSPFKARVKPGRHVFQVRAIKSGAVDASPAVFRWKVTR
jgi:hypothetical protein